MIFREINVRLSESISFDRIDGWRLSFLAILLVLAAGGSGTRKCESATSRVRFAVSRFIVIIV